MASPAYLPSAPRCSIHQRSQAQQLSGVLTKQDDTQKLDGQLVVPATVSQASRSEFAGFVDFRGATFNARAEFTNRIFLDATFFDKCKFLSDAPIFAETELHQRTTWYDVMWPDPPSKQEDARRQTDAYRHLRLRMKQTENYRQEVFFLGKELDAIQRENWLKGDYLRWLPSFIYRVTSNYGTSLARPAIGLFLMVHIATLLFFKDLAKAGLRDRDASEFISLLQCFWLSIANTIPFITVQQKMFPDIFDRLPLWTGVVAGGQTILGVIFLFLIGLALRNRFRIK